MARLAVLILAPALLAGAARAGILTVPGGYPTIQAAVDAAGPGDTVLVAAGTYTGSGNRDISFGGKDLSLIAESGPEATVIDCESSGRALFFGNGESSASLVSGFTLTGGGTALAGGGIDCNNGSSPIVAECRIVGNQGTAGGGVYCEGGAHPAFVACLIADNYSSDVGGGVRVSNASPSFTGCTIVGNQAAGNGGGIYAFVQPGSTMLIIGCTITGNKAARGAGFHFGGSDSYQIEACTMAANHSTGMGGAGYVDVDAGVSFMAVIVWGNCATQGAGLYLAAGSQVGFSCSDFLTSEMEGAGQITPGPDNLSVPPLFCSVTPCAEAPTSDGNYGLDPSSPLLSVLCSTPGGIGVGCDVPIESTTWGAIKAFGRPHR